MVGQRWQREHDYHYACEQLKAIRQARPSQPVSGASPPAGAPAAHAAAVSFAVPTGLDGAAPDRRVLALRSAGARERGAAGGLQGPAPGAYGGLLGALIGPSSRVARAALPRATAPHSAR